MKKLVIFGVGLIGGSLALSLRRTSPSLHIVGVGRSGDNMQHAVDLGVIDQAESDPAVALEGADVVVIATPVAQTSVILNRIKSHLQANTVVTDAGSTKGDVIACAKEILGSKFNQFVAGHPIAGAEKSGVNAARADLFDNKNVVLTPTLETDLKAIATISQLWRDAGARVTEMSTTEHDAIFAAVSHMPHLLAFALVDDLASRDNAQQLFSFAAGGFRDFSRIAASSPEMWRDISLANKDALLYEIGAYEAEISLLKSLIEKSDAAGLQALFERASEARRNWGNQQITNSDKK